MASLSSPPICHAYTPLSLSKYLFNYIFMFCGIKGVMGHWVDKLRYNIWLLLLRWLDIHHSAILKFHITCNFAFSSRFPLLRIFFPRLIQFVFKHINFLLKKKKYWLDMNIRLIRYEYNMWLLKNSRLCDGWTHNKILESYRVVVQSCQLINSENIWNRIIGTKLKVNWIVSK